MISFSKKYIFIVFGIAIIAVLAVVWYWRGPVTPVPTENIASHVQNNNVATTTPATVLKNVSVSAGQAPYRGEPIATLKEGDIGDGFPESYKAKLRAELGTLAKKVASGDAGLDDWLRIGVIKKVFRDFNGARDAWEYAASVYTLNSLPFYNLGDLYGSYLKDFPKAESAFEHAIKLDPKKAGFYTSFAEFYRYFYTVKKDLVISTIESGLKQLPNDPILLMYLGSYYRDDLKDNVKAILYYEKVLVQDPSNSGLKDEINRLKSLQ